MGFLDAMKGANNSWGVVTGNFMNVAGYLGPKNLVDNRAQELMISGTGLKDSIVFSKNDVASITVLFATSEWVKYRLCLKDGKEAVVTILALSEDQKGKKGSMNLLNADQNGKKVSMNLLNFETVFADIIYK